MVDGVVEAWLLAVGAWLLTVGAWLDDGISLAMAVLVIVVVAAALLPLLPHAASEMTETAAANAAELLAE
ncbi:hypothetical protein [Allobranchiibius sp. CTAmp26]|uniref:hypothetical protein n=1 Tax=Allobranchiibius sp. CTAmp26 TaxID=2815214 RepID=UPI001AA0D8A3|nr:hypothetical protein [Allobranchiibius sp. CTAmp26]MBO1756242.1 hypothetical protein [Allobranchiibius sp. CTAmp26]